MPDLPLDTLLIIGLVIASFVGKIFQRKKESEGTEYTKPSSSPPTTNSDETGNLEESLKDIWKRAFQPEEPAPFSPNQEELKESPAPRNVRKPSPKPQVTKKKKLKTGFSYSKKKSNETPTQSWLTSDLKTSQSSLKKAIVLKEILDKPVSLRSFSE